MYIKGTFYIARKDALIHEHGEVAWAQLDAELRERAAIFRRPITPATMIPLADYVRFQEAWLARFHDGDERAYWKVGASWAGWALTRGPYRHLLAGLERSGEQISSVLARLWRVYTDAGELIAEHEGDRLSVEICDLPEWHLSLEYSTMGYVEKTVELALARMARPRRIFGAAEGRVGCHYAFELGEAVRRSPRPREDPSEDITRRASPIRDLIRS